MLCIHAIAVPILKIRTEAKELNYLVKVTWLGKWQNWLLNISSMTIGP